MIFLLSLVTRYNVLSHQLILDQLTNEQETLSNQYYQGMTSILIDSNDKPTDSYLQYNNNH